MAIELDGGVGIDSPIYIGDGSQLTGLNVDKLDGKQGSDYLLKSGGPKVVMAGYNNVSNRTAHSWEPVNLNWFETPVDTAYITVSNNRVTFVKPGAYSINYFAMSHDNNRYYAHHKIGGAVTHHTHTYGYQWVDHNFNLAHKFTAGEYVDFTVYKQGDSNSYTWHAGGTYSMITITYLGEG